MKKLRLHIEDLAVETFTTGGIKGVHGTVQGHATGPVVCPTREVSCNATVCPYNCAPTHDASCDISCYAGCFPTNNTCYGQQTCVTCINTCPATCYPSCGETCTCQNC
jgi:hypothetical protein